MYMIPSFQEQCLDLVTTVAQVAKEPDSIALIRCATLGVAATVYVPGN